MSAHPGPMYGSGLLAFGVYYLLGRRNNATLCPRSLPLRHTFPSRPTPGVFPCPAPPPLHASASPRHPRRNLDPCAPGGAHGFRTRRRAVPRVRAVVVHVVAVAVVIVVAVAVAVAVLPAPPKLTHPLRAHHPRQRAKRARGREALRREGEAQVACVVREAVGGWGAGGADGADGVGERPSPWGVQVRGPERRGGGG